MKWYSSLILISGIHIFACQPAKEDTVSGSRPNIILIMADDLGYETIGVNGGQSYSTPEIDRLASEGMLFQHCYSQPLCTPSRVQIMTGIYNVRNYREFGVLDEGETTFGHLFQKAGYSTAVIGKWQLGKDRDFPSRAGFDRHFLWQVLPGATDSTGRDTRYSKPLLQRDGEEIRFESLDYAPDLLVEYAMQFMEESHDKGEPFFLYYPMILTHCPFSPTPDSPEWLTDDTTVMKYKGKARYFSDMMSYTDKIVGKIDRKLEEMGISDNTLLIFTGDNGTDLPVVSKFRGGEVAGAKKSTSDGGTHVPLVVKWPGHIAAGSGSGALVDFTDFFPTLAEVAGIPLPDSLDLDGRSFLHELEGREGDTREWVYSWFSRKGDDSDARVFVRNQRYKLYREGGFYDIAKDPLEEHPLDIQTLNEEERALMDSFEEVISEYQQYRVQE